VKQFAAFVALSWLILATSAHAQGYNLFVSDQSSNTVKMVTPGGVVSTFATGFNVPTGLAFDSSGNLFVSDDSNDLIKKITPGGVVSSFATLHSIGLAFDTSGNLYAAAVDGTSHIMMYTPSGTPSVFATDVDPGNIAFDSSGNLFVSNQFTETIDKITPGGVVSTFASAGIFSPEGLAFDSSGNLFEADGNNVIHKITPGGVVSTFVSGLSFPMALAFDPAGSGNLYEADAATNSIKMITPGGVITTFATGFNFPNALAFSPAPEPGTIFMLVGGLALLGAVVRRRKF